MPRVVLAPALARWLAVVPAVGVGELAVPVVGTTLRDCLAQLFARHPGLRGYVVDERGALRHHVVAFVNGTAVTDKLTLADPVAIEDEIYLFQALSGG